jgi:maltose O-acetyltransferase
MASAVQLLAADHPLDAVGRASGREFGSPITLEDDVWLGGGAIVCPGVTIGRASVIGAGSVVTKDIPAGVVAAGNPCRVLREIA